MNAENAERTEDNRLLARAIIVSQFAPPFMFSGVAVTLPIMGTDLHAGAVSLGLIETSFLAAQLASFLAVGRIADATDKRTLYKFGLLLFALASGLIGMLSYIPAIIFLRVVQGISSAIFASTGPAILSEIVPKEKRGKAYGSSIGAIYSGLTLGPLIAGYLGDSWGWRAVFFGGSAVLVLATVLINSLMKSSWKKPEAKVLHLGSVALVTLAVFSFVAGSSTIHEGAIAYIFLICAVLFVVWFVKLQEKISLPLLNVSAMVKNHALSSALLIQFLLYVNAFSSMFMLSLYMQIPLGYPAKVSGQVLAIGTALMAIVAPFAGRLSDRYRPRKISCFGVLCVGIGTVMATMLHNTSGLVYITLVLAVQGLGFALFSSPNMSIIMSSVPPNKASMASALGAKSRSLGMLMGMLIATTLIAVNFGNDPISLHPLQFISAMVDVFKILALLTVGALLNCFLTSKKQQVAK